MVGDNKTLDELPEHPNNLLAKIVLKHWYELVKTIFNNVLTKKKL